MCFDSKCEGVMDADSDKFMA